jgi:hypothetical protein
MQHQALPIILQKQNLNDIFTATTLFLNHAFTLYVVYLNNKPIKWRLSYDYHCKNTSELFSF